VAIASGPSSAAFGKLVNIPEERRNATVLYVFSL
jgi:hypothetical protein